MPRRSLLQLAGVDARACPGSTDWSHPGLLPLPPPGRRSCATEHSSNEAGCEQIGGVTPSFTCSDRQIPRDAPLDSPWRSTYSPRIQCSFEHRGSEGEVAVNIKAGMEKVPGGLMLVPLLVGALIHTLAPDAGKFFGSFTGALFTGLAPILGVFYVCLGSTLDVKATPYIAKKGGALLGAKISFAILVGVILGRFLGEAPVVSGVFTGLSVLAVVAALNDTNGGMYMSLMWPFGRNRDVGAYSVMSL